MSNGTMKLVEDILKGEIRTLRISQQFWLEVIKGQKAEKAPDYKIMAKSPLGHTCEIGVAWERTMQRGNNIGQSMFSLSFTDPSFGDDAVNFSAFPNEDGYELTFERKRVQGSPVVGNEAQAA